VQIGKHDSFAHLHVASAYSLRYGTARPDRLAARAAELGMDILGLTDRDGLYGAVKHLDACAAHGLTPVIGSDLAMAPGHGLDLDARRRTAPRPERVVVLAEGTSGWPALCRLITTAHGAAHPGEDAPDWEWAGWATDGGVRADRAEVTREAVGERGGLVVLLGPDSEVGRAVAARQEDLAARLLRRWCSLCPGRVVIELVDRYGRGEHVLAGRMLALAQRYGLPAVLTNAVRYLRGADSHLTHVLDAARQLVPLHRRHLEDQTGHAYLKSGQEMKRVAEMICGPDEMAVRRLLRTTRDLAERCALDPDGLDLGRARLPEVAGDAFAELRARVEEGLVRRGTSRERAWRDAARDRLEHELVIIARHSLAPYFLTVADAAALIRSRGIRTAIRGSGAGSLVNHLLGIGEIDPLDHGLVMERFLSDGRPGLPDIDLDVESARRLEAYRLIFERYGPDRVACVSMVETYRARSAIRDVGAAAGLPAAEIDTIAKAFPQIRAGRIRAALRDLPELRELRELRRSGMGESRLAGLLRIAERLDGLPRHLAMHPCGILLSDAGLRDRTPVEISAAGFPMSQYDKDDVERMGFLKLDVIGVRMQSAMAHAVAEVARVQGESIDLEAVPRDDEPTFELIRSSNTLGCFQIESPGQRELVGKLGPRTLDDLVIDISLFRPGPVNADMITPFLDARHGRRAISYPHPDLAGILEESHGVVVFHEQVLRIMDVMTGCGLSEAERMRRRLAEEAAEVAGWFQRRAVANGYRAPTVRRVWRMLAAFGAFGFCKGHAASFALPTYQSAWLKRHHPAAFYAGVLTHDPGLYPARAILDDARRFGVPILPLDVNRSGTTWEIEAAPAPDPSSLPPQTLGGVPADPGAPPSSTSPDASPEASPDASPEASPDASPDAGIRVALSEVRGISQSEIVRIVAGRPYTSLADFWERARVSRPILERLILVGGFDRMYGERRDLLCQISALERGHGPAELPLGLDEGPSGLPPMTQAEVVKAELDILGMDVSRHVLSFYRRFLAELGVTRAEALPGLPDGTQVTVAGVKIASQTPAVRSGQRIIFLTLDDATGPVDLTFFESVQEHCAATAFGSWLLVARGRLRRPGGRAVSITATDCWELGELHRAWKAGAEPAELLRPAATTPQRDRRPARMVYDNGYALSPYADLGAPGTPGKQAPRGRWEG